MLDRTIDSRRVRFRPIAPTDAPKLLAGIKLLSPETKLARFFFLKSSFSEEELHHLTHCDGITHVSLVAELIDEPDAPLVGVARWLRTSPQEPLAEIAFVVRDDWQHHGIGKTLLELLAAAARRLGVSHVRAQVLMGNVASEHTLEHIGTLQARTVFGAGAYELTYKLHPAAPAT